MRSIHSVHTNFSYGPFLRKLTEDSSFVCYKQSYMFLPMPNLNKIPKQFMTLIRQTHCHPIKHLYCALCANNTKDKL